MIISPLRRIKGIKAYVLTGLLALISLIHYLVGGAPAGILHGLLGHLYIVPIILGAYWYGVKGGRVGFHRLGGAFLTAPVPALA